MSALAITYASTSPFEPVGIMFIQGLCVTQLATYCASNKLYYHYNQPEVGLIIGAGGAVQALVLFILCFVTDVLAGFLYIPMMVSCLGLQIAFGFWHYRKNGARAPDQPKFDLSTMDPGLISNYIRIG
mmetsp:Transcript_12954/g.24053  ORF Transcript_12954/g.24053 Transcript_12954/m.24053 type:complete len:128 (-) Transcript_12954:27-410(-)|eukprot:CAMPEP_0204902956 /NCGR_PEP_ID=MMETSP1397-20131031/3978_1 /ASSEMBLY_ACC=CAM_ASM_000891 /TAXON_ID=49980 /ORGANISM="Climacostomum Climacostomum virens, Strain Stock W-24" /LENGTH=127 /DNA_ID=CAMNT_0052071533 /DNA_START=138 /DNA_END=521 /DNA_ORIENTATION=-